MATRKTPILLRRAPLSGDVMALHRYTRRVVRGKEVIDAGFEGKQDVTADFDALVCEALLDNSELGIASPDIIAILDGVADGLVPNEQERAEVRAFRERLKALVERHNDHGHGRVEG